MTPSSAPLRVAFVGAGAQARAHARALRRIATPVAIAGVFDADDSAAEEFAAAYPTGTFRSLGTLLASARPDIVHVCTTAGAHFEVAREALLAGAHIYVEKPFVETLADARTILALAAARHRLVCAGHQLLADPVFSALQARAGNLKTLVRTESLLSFASPTVRHDAPAQTRVAQLLDVLPHPLYTLVAALERMAPGERIGLSACTATPDSVEALIEAGAVQGRLLVSLCARPVLSTLSIVGSNGTLTADFIRGCVTGVVNPGTTPIEKILNPAFEGATLGARSLAGVARRITSHGEYPGLAQLLEAFYSAIRAGTPSPTTSEHLLQVVGLYEEMVTTVRESETQYRPRPSPRAARSAVRDAPVVALTGASGFLGRALARHLHERGFQVRGIGRGPDPQDTHITDWVRADCSRDIPPHAFDGAYAVIHAAAATSGGFSAHQRHSVEAARRVVDAASTAGVPRLVHISSLSVLQPPRGYSDVQSETTPLAERSESLGPYAWGKCASERLVLDRAAAAGIQVRVIRPGALTDRRAPDLPGLLGRRLFGSWHLMLGRPSYAFAACDVELAAEAIAWCVASFDDAPSVVNLIDPGIATRAALIRRMRADGWVGRGIWVPISLLAAGVSTARWAISKLRGTKSGALAVWQVLRPRQFDTTVSARLLQAMRRNTNAEHRAPRLDHRERIQLAANEG